MDSIATRETCPNILLVEDNYDDAELIEFQLEVLKQQGLLVEHCDCLAKALDRLGHEGIGLILLDLSLPDSSGIATVKKVRQAAPSLPLIVLTGAADNEIAMQALASGAQDFLVKGRIDFQTLWRSISYAVARQNSADLNAQLAAIVESSADAIIGKTLSGTITTWNAGAELLFGYSSKEATGQSVGLIIPSDRPHELAEVLAKLKLGEVVRQETVRVKKDGQRVEIYQTISPIEMNGTITGASAIDQDITVRKEAQLELKHSEQRLALALKSAAVGVWDLDLVNNTVWRSLRHDEIFGHHSLLSAWSYDIFVSYVVPGDRQNAREVLKRAVESPDGQFQLECRIIRADDKSLRWISAQAETFRDERGTPIRIMGTVVDTTTRKEQEEQLRLMAIMKEREDFMATLTHDMKNPLIGSKRLLEMLVEGNLGTLTREQCEVLDVIKESASGVLALIRNLIDVYRLESNVNSMTIHDCDLLALVASSVMLMMPLAKLRGIDLITELPQQLVEIQADSSALARVLQNLLDNAIKFTPPGGRITLRLYTLADHVVLEVEDTGDGISADEIEHLFKKFSQGETGKRYVGGSGLGLYLCKQIIDAHHGSIECQSAVNVSTIFRVKLPFSGPTLANQQRDQPSALVAP